MFCKDRFGSFGRELVEATLELCGGEVVLPSVDPIAQELSQWKETHLKWRQLTMDPTRVGEEPLSAESIGRHVRRHFRALRGPVEMLQDLPPCSFLVHRCERYVA